MLRPPPRSTLFPYTTLFRFSLPVVSGGVDVRNTAARGGTVTVTEYGRPCHGDRKSTRLNSSHANISYAVFCLKKKKKKNRRSYNDINTPDTIVTQSQTLARAR